MSSAAFEFAAPHRRPARRSAAMLLGVALLGVAQLGAARPAAAQPEPEGGFHGPHGYVVVAHFSLDGTAHGIDGALELLLDDRINGRTRRAYAQMYWFGVTDTPAVEESVMGQTLIAAKLRLVSRDGEPLAEHPLPTPFAEVQPVALSAAQPHDFLVLVQQGGFDAVNGTIGVLLGVADGRIHPLRATDALSGEEAAIELLRTVGADWRIVPNPSGPGAEILQISCAPEDIAEDGFREVYARYHRLRDGWHYDTRLERGYCNWPGDFPARDLFP